MIFLTSHLEKLFLNPFFVNSKSNTRFMQEVHECFSISIGISPYSEWLLDLILLKRRGRISL